MTKENCFLTDDQVSTIESQLLSEQEKLTRNQNGLESFCLDQNELSDPLDEASVNVQASQELRFRNREVFYLKKLNQSLERIKRGTYGLCDSCDAEISYERLLARPTAELCISCKEEAELCEQNNFYQKRSKSLGKTIAEL